MPVHHKRQHGLVWCTSELFDTNRFELHWFANSALVLQPHREYGEILSSLEFVTGWMAVLTKPIFPFKPHAMFSQSVGKLTEYIIGQSAACIEGNPRMQKSKLQRYMSSSRHDHESAHHCNTQCCGHVAMLPTSFGHFGGTWSWMCSQIVNWYATNELWTPSPKYCADFQ